MEKTLKNTNTSLSTNVPIFFLQASSIMQPMDSRISNYIKKVVTEHGVTSTLKMKLLIEVFLKQSIFPDSPLPPKHNKRFWPSLKDIYNHMAVQFLKLRDSSFDQVLAMITYILFIAWINIYNDHNSHQFCSHLQASFHVTYVDQYL